MRLLLVLGALALALIALPVGGATPGRQLRLPLVARESTPTPVPTPTPAVVRIQYRANVQDHGWLPWQDEGGMAGMHALQIKAIEMRVVSGPPGTGIQYRAHIRHFGWQPHYIVDGGTAGSPAGDMIEAIQVGLVNPPPNTYLAVEPYIQDWGWSGYVRDLWEAGTTGQGRRLEGFRAYVRTGSPEPARVGVAYNANPRGMGYLGWKRDGEEAGTRGKLLPLDSFRVGLYNRPEGMRIQYRCWVQDSDWQPWQEDGAGECGLFGTNKAIYAIEMRLIDPYPGTILSYTAHVQNRGDITWSSDNQVPVGYPPDKLQIENIRVSLRNPVP